MNIGTIDLLVSNHIDGLRRQAPARRTGAPGRESQPASPADRGPKLRSRIGFALVEAGLHLQAAPDRYHAGRRMASE